MKVWLWILIGVAILLLLSSREGFSSTETIKDPSTWDSEEINRIRSMTTPISTATDTEIRNIVGGFWATWTNEKTQLTMAQITNYLATTSVSPEKRGEFAELLRKYYIDQGTSVFQAARNYVEEVEEETPPTTSNTVVVRPSLADSAVRQTISTYTGIPANKDADLRFFETRMQKFYDTTYTTNKNIVTVSDVNRFVQDEPIDDVPEQMKPSFKPHLTSILDYYFTEPSMLPSDSTTTLSTPSTSSSTSSVSSSTSSSTNPRALPSGGILQGMNVYGPVYAGVGETSTTKGDSSRTNIYPSLLGGFGGSAMPQSEAVANTRTLTDFALPPIGTLGVDERSKFLPYSRVPGDMDVIQDPYRLGNTSLSTSSYSSVKTDPVPFLTDFSAFFK